MGNNKPAVDQSDLRIRSSYGLMKSTKVQKPRRKCSTVVETNFLVAEYRIQYRIMP